MSGRRPSGNGAAAAAALALASCAVGPNYHRPPAPVPAAYKELPPGWKLGTPQDTKDRGDWWQIFNDPQLDQLERQVNISNQNVKQYEAQYREAAALLREAEAQLFPTLTASFGGQRGGGGGGTAAVSSAVGSGAGGSTHTEFTLEGVLSWQPDVWGTIRRQVESRKAGVQVSEANLANARLSAQAMLATDYFDLRAADSLRKLLTQAVALDRARPRDHPESVPLRHRDQRRSGGGASRARGDASPADRGGAAARHLRARHRHAHRASAGGIGRRRGASCDHGARGAGDRAVRIAGAQPEHRRGGAADAAGERAHRRRDRCLLSDHQFGCARWVLRQSVVESDQSREPHLVGGGTASDTLFQGGEQVAAVAQARATYDQYVASYRQTVLSTFQSVEDQLLALRVLQHEAEFQSKAVGHAQTAADVALNQFNAGTVSYTTVITDIQMLIADQESLLTIQQNQLVADVSLIEALGGGWDVSHLK